MRVAGPGLQLIVVFVIIGGGISEIIVGKLTLIIELGVSILSLGFRG